VTLTPSRRPLIERRWLRPGTHINAIGADAPGKQELRLEVLRHAGVIVDDYEQAAHAGEINVPISRRQYAMRQLRGSLGEVLLGRKPGRCSAQEITVFDSTGLAIHDVAVAYEAFQRARRRRLGQAFQFFDKHSS
jgi:alanine dehydrogenase